MVGLILSDRDIRAALQRLENPLIVDPGFDPQRLQPASLELTLANDVLRQGLGTGGSTQTGAADGWSPRSTGRRAPWTTSRSWGR